MRVGKQNKSINKWNKRFVPFQKEQKGLGTLSFSFIFFLIQLYFLVIIGQIQNSESKSYRWSARFYWLRFCHVYCLSKMFFTNRMVSILFVLFCFMSVHLSFVSRFIDKLLKVKTMIFYYHQIATMAFTKVPNNINNDI